MAASPVTRTEQPVLRGASPGMLARQTSGKALMLSLQPCLEVTSDGAVQQCSPHWGWGPRLEHSLLAPTSWGGPGPRLQVGSQARTLGASLCPEETTLTAN